MQLTEFSGLFQKRKIIQSHSCISENDRNEFGLQTGNKECWWRHKQGVQRHLPFVRLENTLIGDHRYYSTNEIDTYTQSDIFGLTI